MSSDTHRPFDADEADVIEQHQSITDDGDDGDGGDEIDLPDELPLADADPADALDQYLSVPVDDDWRTETNS